MSGRVVVVGGGIVGTFHAWEAVRRGWEVVHLERDAAPRGASARNFGLVWVSGRASGRELAVALRARERWEQVAADVSGVGFRAAGSLTVATDEDGAAALGLAAAVDDAGDRGFCLLDANEVRRRCPAIGGAVTAALWCERDASVEPRLVPSAFRAAMSRSGRYEWRPGRHVWSLDGSGAVDHMGERHHGDLVVVCPGAAYDGVLAEVVAELPLRRVRLQMLETAPLARRVGPSLADVDSLRYYPAFAGAPRERLGPQDPLAAAWAAQLLVVQRLDGSLTIGDTHCYDEPFAFDYDTEPERHLLATAARLFGSAPPAVRRRWTGVYSESTDGRLYARAEVRPGVVVVTGPGGRGMTLSPAIAEETFT